MHLHLGGIFENTITKSNFSHFSEKGAAAWGPVDDINWAMSRKLSNKIQYLLRKKLSAGRARTMLVLKAALEAHKQGYKLVDGVWPCELSQETVPAVQETSLVRYNQP